MEGVMVKVIDYNPGTKVYVDGRHFLITKIIDYNTVLAKDLATGAASSINISSISSNDLSEYPLQQNQILELSGIDEKKWVIANERYKAIRPLLNTKRTLEMVERRAEKAGVTITTIYRWIKRYECMETVSSLLPSNSGPKWGSRRISEEIEEIIRATIDEKYLNAQKPSIQYVCNEISRRCFNAGLKGPHDNTIRHRINRISRKIKVKRRQGAQAATNEYAPFQGKFPGANRPLEVIQIDHTKVDLDLVDDVSRRPIGRPWITIAIDVFSRMVTGFYVSFDPPGALSVGQCLAHSILPKETWLAKIGVDSEWPIWGLPGIVHADNAKEFRGKMLSMACEEYQIDLHWRPVARPHYGGHIERLLGSLNGEIHALPGSTFSNVQKKGKYDSMAQATLTLVEFEKWLTILILDLYHKKFHSSLGTSPREQYMRGILGDDTNPGTGIPPRVKNESKLWLDFLPVEERTVQKYGIALDNIYYYSDALRQWINAIDPDNPKRKRFFAIRRDPRDISKIYFYDPEIKDYFEVPYREASNPSISIWELREAQKRLRAEGKRSINESDIFIARNQLRELEKEAHRETTKVRRLNQLLRTNNTSCQPIHEENQNPNPLWNSIDREQVKPFDLEELDD